MAFPDDDPESEFKPDDPDLLRNRSIAQRFLVISAGIIANCIFAYSILFVQASRLPHSFKPSKRFSFRLTAVYKALLSLLHA